MRIILPALLLLLVPFCAQAAEYGLYDTKKILTTTGTKQSLDLEFLDIIIEDLSQHALTYPPRFNSAQEHMRASKDAETVTGIFNQFVGENPPTAMLERAAYLNSIAHNLDVTGTDAKAKRFLNLLLAAKPADPRANYVYGNLLAGSEQPKQALPYLEKALKLGIKEATYSLGKTYLSLADKQKALAFLRIYLQENPNDQGVKHLVQGLQNGTFQLRTRPKEAEPKN